MTAPVTWVVGAGGLLGSRVAELVGTRYPMHVPVHAIRWGVPESRVDLSRAIRGFAQAADGGSWQIAWCAGAGVVGARHEDLTTEVEQFEGFLSGLEQAGLKRGAGLIFLASSAGGVYAGAKDPPFTELTVPKSISPYGDAKLAMETALTKYALSSQNQAAIGRISNLYGPGQKLHKPQGLLSQIVRAHLLRRPISVFVSLDTLRDYIYTPDCANLIVDLCSATRERFPRGVTVTKILASQRAVTIAAILGEIRRLLRRPPDVVYGASPTARFQVRDLRLRSVVLPDLDARTLTTLPAGLRAVIDDLTLLHQQGGLV